ncbi:MAG TPA: hypothetical protein VJC18_04995, partial [bacterium]|nr:hypothetical protein [bacterium]
APEVLPKVGETAILSVQKKGDTKALQANDDDTLSPLTIGTTTYKYTQESLEALRIYIVGLFQNKPEVYFGDSFASISFSAKEHVESASQTKFNEEITEIDRTATSDIDRVIAQLNTMLQSHPDRFKSVTITGIASATGVKVAGPNGKKRVITHGNNGTYSIGNIFETDGITLKAGYSFASDLLAKGYTDDQRKYHRGNFDYAKARHDAVAAYLEEKLGAEKYKLIEAKISITEVGGRREPSCKLDIAYVVDTRFKVDESAFDSVGFVKPEPKERLAQFIRTELQAYFEAPTQDKAIAVLRTIAEYFPEKKTAVAEALYTHLEKNVASAPGAEGLMIGLNTFFKLGKTPSVAKTPVILDTADKAPSVITLEPGARLTIPGAEGASLFLGSRDVTNLFNYSAGNYVSKATFSATDIGAMRSAFGGTVTYAVKTDGSTKSVSVTLVGGTVATPRQKTEQPRVVEDPASPDD